MTSVLRIAAFSDGNKDGNPAGVWMANCCRMHRGCRRSLRMSGSPRQPLPRRSARRGASATSPSMEVPFCGHATITLGAALAHRYGDRSYDLH